MAHIFKHPYQGQNGIVVITHKEFRFSTIKNKIKFKGIFKPHKLLSDIFSNKTKDAFQESLKEISSGNYFLGVHWGSYRPKIQTPDWIDFHLCAPGTGSFEGDPFVIPMNSANFTPAVMRPRKKEKYWDIICVSKNVYYKKLDLFLETVRKIYDAGKKYRILLVVATNQDEQPGRFYTEIHNDYYKLFNSEERERFSIVKTHPETGFQGFSYELISHFYNQSKVFTLFSSKEGESRVIKEAQLCGLPVVVYSELVGGGRDYLTAGENALFFDTYEDAHKSLIEAVENYANFKIDYDKIHQEIGEAPSLAKLKASFTDLFAQHYQEFDGELINTDCLNRRLPAHYFDPSVSWASTPEYRFKTTDIRDLGTLENFKKCLQLSKSG